MLKKINFILVGCDKVATLDNQIWSFIHVYAIE
jgi:hypothetical protein